MKKSFRMKRVWPVLVSLGSASIMILAFFIPSIQDQWDRYESRQIIEQYEGMGNDFFDEGRYEMAEKAYERAFELSGEKRLDIEVKRLDARVNRMNVSESWGSKAPEELQEIDFQYLLHMQKGRNHEKHRIATLNSYGVFLSSKGRLKEAKATFMEALKIDSLNALIYINLGNLYDQQEKKAEAEKAYRRAAVLDPTNIQAHYNLGLLYAEQEKLEKAKEAFGKAKELDPADQEIANEYNLIIKRLSDH